MINFRYHIVSLAAVFLALAAGIAIGAGLLDDAGSGGGEGGEARIDPALVSFESSYAASTAGPLLDNRLNGATVVVVTMPGARAAEVKGLVANVRTAGGTVVGEVAMTGKLLDAANRQFAEGVAQEAAADVDGVDAAGDSYGRIGTALARAFLASSTEDVDQTATTIRTAFAEGGLIDLPSTPDRRAQLALVVAGPSASDSARGDIIAQLTQAFAQNSRGALLAGPSLTSADGGVVAVARNNDASSSFSTVDVTDTAAGRVVAIVALAKAAAGDNGAWGTTRSANGALPQ